MDSLKKIINSVFSVQIESTNRSQKTVDARRAYCKILRDEGFSYQHIGSTLNKTHATIIHYTNTINSLLRYDTVFYKKFILAKEDFYKENKSLILYSKEDIYSVSFILENKLNKIILNKNNVLEKLNNDAKENKNSKCIDYCRELIMSLFDD